MYYCHNKILYRLDNEYKTCRRIYTIEGHNFNYFYEYFDNNNEVIIIVDDKLVLINNDEEIKTLPFKYNFYDMRDIVKHKDQYYILMRTQIIILDSDLNYIEHNIFYNLNQYDLYRKLVKLHIYKDELYITYYNANVVNDEETLITISLIKVDLEQKIYNHEEILTNTVSTPYTGFVLEGYELHNICVNNEYITYLITDKATHDNLLINHNLLTKETNYNNKEKNHIFTRIKNYGYKLVCEDTHNLYTKSFVMYDMKTLEFKEYITIDKVPKNGYLNIILNKNNLLIIINKNYTNPIGHPDNYQTYIYEKILTKKDILLGALALKYSFKEKLGIDYGCHRDIKEFILEKMKCKVELDENDNILKYEITDEEYKFIREVDNFKAPH
jgi:hypothetical protein